MPKTKVEVYDKNQLIYPFIESDHVTFSNGMKVSEMLDQSISMPTVTHEDLSFKVGVGDQDVSSAVVDSSVAKMTIKGKTYQNILPEPSTHVLTNNKEIFKVNEGLDPNVEIVDGVSKSAILSGQTLNNIALTINNVIHKNAGIVVTKPSLYDMAKRYIVMFDVVEKPDTLYMKLEGATGGTWKCDLSSQKLIDSVGRYYLISNVSSVQHKQIKLTNASSSSERCIVTNVNVIEYQNGMENWDIPHFEGMQSVKMPVLNTVGSNVFDGDNSMELGAWSSNSNPVEVSNEIRCKNKHTPFPNGLKNGDVMRIVLSDTSINSNTNMHVYDESKTRITTLGYETNPYIEGTNFINGVSTITIHDVSKCKYFSFRAVSTNTECKFAIMVNTSAPYEHYKSNILSTPEEVVLRSLPNGVCDTLNLNTGEYVQRIGEVVLNGSENWVLNTALTNDNGYYTFQHLPPNGLTGTNRFEEGVACDKFSRTYDTKLVNAMNKEYCCYHGWSRGIGICINGDKLSTRDANGFKQWLSQNPTTVQYELAKPITKTVDLSSSGNWEKVVLDGSERWTNCTDLGDGYYRFQRGLGIFNNPYKDANNMGRGFSDTIKWHADWTDKSEGFYFDSVLVFRIHGSKLSSLSNEGFELYLSQNPITVWYQIATHQDSTQVKQPIFFKDGHIQLSSGADHSLIPTLNYQAKTSNSYMMDLMKANTRYTMKAKSASGTFTIDGTSYGAGTNGTFTTPSSITNKLLVMSNKANEEVMILEGDLTSKTIPYFKGIKSAFEGEDKIEVLSTGKNLFDNSRVNNYLAEYLDNGYVKATGGKQGDIFAEQKAKPFIKPNTKYTITVDVIENTMTGLFEVQYSGDRRASLKTSFYIDAGFVGRISRTCDSKEVIENELVLVPKVITQNTSGHVIFRIIVEETSTPTSYEPHKSNSTKIPLLSPLRSLPNGVYDELIIDRMKNKATLIQRVGYSVINSEFAKNGESWANNNDTDPCWGFHCGNYVQGSFKLNEHNSINDKLPIKGMATTGDPLMGYYQSNPHIAVRRLEASNLTMALNWLDRNPINFYYQLATPVITEVDLEGFPYIYKDGHIFLNSEITPTTEITYSINQCQQISASNEDIIRHEKELTYLQKLIAQYVQVDYESALLSLKV